MIAGLRKEVNHYRRCIKLIGRVDRDVFVAGMEMLEDDATLALWLSSPARSLGGSVPVDIMRSAKGRQQVASILRALANGHYL